MSACGTLHLMVPAPHPGEHRQASARLMSCRCQKSWASKPLTLAFLAITEPAALCSHGDWILLPVLHLILKFLSKKDVRRVRLTASCFRSHTAVLERCSSVSCRRGACMAGFQAGLQYLQQLPHLRKLSVTNPRTLTGVAQLARLTMLEIVGCRTFLDLYPLADLPHLHTLSLKDSKGTLMSNISELRSLHMLKIDQMGVSKNMSRLTSLQCLTICHDMDNHAAPCNAHAWSSLTGLTALTDNASSRLFWHKLLALVLLEVNTPPSSLLGTLMPTSLRALALRTGDSEGDQQVLSTLAPLSSLTGLEHLDLTGRTLPLPALPALTHLTLDLPARDDDLPPLAQAPMLQVLELWLDGDLRLPDLSSLVHLGTICYNDRLGCLLLDVSWVSHHQYMWVEERQPLAEAYSESRLSSCGKGLSG